jgi:hypothetical protein
MPLHRLLVAALVASMACTSVKVIQREGCWVKQTERTLGGSSEELGFCSRQAPVWAEDRLSRLTQECMAQADYRWQNRALAAWSRGEPIPPLDADGTIAKNCIAEASQALGLEVENNALKARLGEIIADRDTLRKQVEGGQQFMQNSNDKMVSALGEAAKKPAPAAVATATSTGTAKTDSTQAPAAAPTVVGIAPAAAPVIVTPPSTTVNLPAAAPQPQPQPQKVDAPCAAPRKPGTKSGPAPQCAPAKPAAPAPGPLKADASR